jgi:excisionase family DNA binding protein
MSKVKESHRHNSTDLPEILIKPEIESLLRVSKRQVELLVATRGLPFFRVGKRAVRFNKAEVLDWIAKQGK